MIPALPKLQEGTGSFQRVGQRISNLRGKTHFHFYLPYNASASQNWIVRLYMLSSVQIKAHSALPALNPNTLLDKGDGTTVDWDPTVNQVITLSQLPLARENFRGSFKEFRLSKNSGALNGDASTPPPSPNGGHFATYHDFTWHWKHSGQVMYDENAVYPNNYCPLWAVVAYSPDDYPLTIEATPVKFTSRTEMYYKDS